MRLHVVFVAIGTLLISGCDSSPTTQKTKSVSEALPGVNFDVAPNTLRVCDPAKIVKVSWDATAAEVSTVKIFVSAKEGVEESLFTFQGAIGSVDTGPWVTAASVFVLKDGKEDKQLAKFVVGSESCG
jgi:hypothetical protein